MGSEKKPPVRFRFVRMTGFTLVVRDCDASVDKVQYASNSERQRGGNSYPG